MRVLGAISGTSHDGIDVAVVDFALSSGHLSAKIEHHTSIPYSPSLRDRLVAALPPAQTTLAEIGMLDTLIGQEFAAAVLAAVAQSGPVDLVCSHGQTVFHWIENGRAKGTLQIGQAAWIAEATGAPVVSDLRSRDIAAGGEGAPLVSVLDTLLLAGIPGTRAALNLGGISNMTVVGAGEPVAYDIGPANALIDAAVIATAAHPAGYDVGGALAAAGSVDQALLAVLLDEPYYALPSPKSTGKELFHDRYLRAALDRSGRQPRPVDLIATLTELTVRTVADQVLAQGIGTLAASGGGSHNTVLMAGLSRALPGVRVTTTDELGVPVDAKEAIAFALIGWLTAHGLPGSIASCTGARQARVLGTITPGAAPLRLAEPLAVAPESLSVFGWGAER